MQLAMLEKEVNHRPRHRKYFNSVRKKDRRIVPFSRSKISDTILKAAKISGQDDRKLASHLTDEVEKYLKKNFLIGETLTVEAIQGAVENVLTQQGYPLIAKTYQIFHYRQDKVKKKLTVRKEVKKANNATDISLLVTAPSSEESFTWNRQKIAEALVKEADMPPKAAKQIAREVEKKILASELKSVSTGFIREMVDNELLTMGYKKKLKKQRSLGMPLYDLEQLIFSKNLENSNIATHNPEAINLGIAETTLKQYALDHIFSREVGMAHLSGKIHVHDLGYPTRVYCSSHSLEYLKKYGLNLSNLEIISSPAKHARTLTGHLNTFLASMQAYYAGALGIGYLNILYAPFLVDMSFEKMKQEAQYLIFSGSQNAFSRGGQTLFIDSNIHLNVPGYLKKIKAIGPGGKYTGKTYGDYEKETQMFAKALMEVWRKGDAYGHVFSFPKMDLHINEESFSDPKQRELLEFACQVASENGSPYFVFDREEVTLSQCCRLKTTMDLSDPDDAYVISHPESMRFCGFQNVTINLPQAAYRAGKGNIEGLLTEISDMMNLAVDAHLEKKEFIASLMQRRELPLWQVGKPALDGRPYVNLKRATYIIGLVGLNECVQHLTGKQLHEDEEVYKLGIKIISFMFLKTKEYSKKHELKFALEESPAESAARRLAKVDLREFPESKEVIKGDIKTDQFYYTNSVHYAAAAPMNLIDRIVGQSRFHTLIESGAIIHAFIGEDKPSPESIFKLVEKTWRNTKAAQITISPEFTICNKCRRMTRGLLDTCKHCGDKDVYGVTRIVGYYSRIPNWNKSKIGELKDRHKGDYAIAR
ncbi:MAG: anaerobic ribonucleoside-triphosphate reductase [bacterium]